MKYKRLIVCGDSYSEGMSDEIINGQYRGWADRIADVMAQEEPEFTYLNLENLLLIVKTGYSYEYSLP